MIRYKKGFTLLEISLVIALLAIIAGILLVSIDPNQRLSQTRNLTRRSDVNNLYNALEYYNLRNRESVSTITDTYREICDTGSLTLDDELPSLNYCGDRADLRALVPTYIESIPKDSRATEVGDTGYEVAKTTTNQVSVKANKSELDELIVINPLAPPVPPTPEEPPIPIVCPSGYIKVPGNSLYGTSEFCVMKYEAKNVSGVATSQASGLPWTFIRHNDAIAKCQSSGAGHDLITNAEWMTIARNIEGVASNWTGGAVGSGGLWTGHSRDDSPPNPLAASTDDGLGYTGTGNASPSVQRRTHTLSNGDVLWDFSGNVWEWNKDTIMGINKPNNNDIAGFQEWTSFNTSGSYGNLTYNLTRSINPAWNADTNNMGKYEPALFTGGPYAFRRGGDWDTGTHAGIFALNLGSSPFATQYDIGFRCVFRQ
jgi:prepilin-type N-terminal cleavage/methylation domain-containing protein